MTTAIYVRLTKHHEDEGSLVTQERDCRKYADERDWNDIVVYRENGVSAGRGGDDRRREFKRLRVDIAAGRVDRVLFWKSDRCYRMAHKQLEFVNECREREVTVAFVTQGWDTATKGTRNLMMTVLAAIAEEESEIRRDRQVAHRERMAATGRKRSGGFRRYGYEPDNVTLRPAEVALIRDSAARIVAGDSLRSVAMHWASEGVKNARGDSPHPQSIRRALLNTDLVDAETHEKVKAILEDPARRTSGFNRRTYLLSGGLVHCGLCGERMTAHPSGKTRRYVCRVSVNDRTNGCGMTKIEAELLEEAVVALVRTGFAQGTFAEQFRNIGRPVDFEAIAGERAALEVKLGEIADAFADGTLTKDQARRAKERVQGKLERLSQRIRDAGGAGPDVEALYAQWKRYETPGQSREAFDWWTSLVADIIADIKVTPPTDARKGDISIDLNSGNSLMGWWVRRTNEKLKEKPPSPGEVTWTKG